MRYEDLGLQIPSDKRAAYNEKVLADVLGAAQGRPAQISKADAFNAFTGKGGLHGLSFSDYGSRTRYDQARRLEEEGQFFTPGRVAAFIAGALRLPATASVCDPACGHGALLNAFAAEEGLAQTHRLLGCDVDPDAVAVARHLFPEADVERVSMTLYDPGFLVDAVVTNPPFSVKVSYPAGDTLRAEDAVVRQAAAWLRPGGLMALLVSAKLFSDAFHERARIDDLEGAFSVLGRVLLPADAFAGAGVKDFATQVVLLQRWNPALPADERAAYADAPVWEAATVGALGPLADEVHSAAVAPAQARATALRAELELAAARARGEDDRSRVGLADRVAKLLYDVSRAVPARASEARGVYDRYLTQQEDLKDNYHALQHLSPEERRAMFMSDDDLLAQLQAILSAQHEPRVLAAKRERLGLPDGPLSYRLVRAGDRLFYKGYSEAGRATLEAVGAQEWSVSELASNDGPLPEPVAESPWGRVVERKRRRRRRYAVDLMGVTPDPALVARIRSLEVRNRHGETIAPTEIQARDLARVWDREWAYLDWQQGTGKTLAGYLWSHRDRPARARVFLAPALAIDQTWRPFLDAQGDRYLEVRRRSDLEDAFASADFGHDPTVLVSFSMVAKLGPALRSFVERCHRQVAVVVDEADEMASYESRQTHGALHAFRRARYKLLMTGTATRNHLGEYYPQLEVLYNNSELMACDARHWWVEHPETGDLVPKANPHHGRPFPAYRGKAVFDRCFCPRKATVFGILKHDQDVYNAEAFADLVSKTRLVRSFAEVAGPDRFSLHNHTVEMSSPEATLHQDLVKEFHRFLSYFESTGDKRKDAGLAAVRQLRLLIDSCSHPELFPDFEGDRSRPSRKMRAALALVHGFSDELVAVGLRRREAFGRDVLAYWRRELEARGRTVFTVSGDDSFAERGRALDAFQASGNGVLVSTQQSLASSVNVPACNRVVVPALGWNVPRIMQYAFRFIRFDMDHPTEVHFVTYDRSIEANLWALLLNKERLNAFIKTGAVPSTSSMVDALGLEAGVLDTLMTKVRDDDGNVVVNWTQRFDHDPVEAVS